MASKETGFSTMGERRVKKSGEAYESHRNLRSLASGTVAELSLIVLRSWCPSSWSCQVDSALVITLRTKWSRNENWGLMCLPGIHPWQAFADLGIWSWRSFPGFAKQGQHSRLSLHSTPSSFQSWNDLWVPWEAPAVQTGCRTSRLLSGCVSEVSCELPPL